MLSGIRDRLNPWIEKLARPFVALGLKPNHVTLVALIIGISAGILFSYNHVRWAGFVVLVGGFFDIIDGAVARISGYVTKLGGVLDSVCDRVTDAALYIGIMASGIGGISSEPAWLLPVLALVGSLLVSYVRARAESAGTGKLDVGVAERAERLIVLALGALLGLIDYALLIIVLLTFFTVLQRIWTSKKRLTSSLKVSK